MKTIIVSVENTGEVQIETTGFKGKACEAATKALETAMGVKTNSRKKPEYHAEDKPQLSTGN